MSYKLFILLSLQFAIFFIVIRNVSSEDDPEDPSCSNVPEDRFQWCTDEYKDYKCTPDDKQSIKTENNDFIIFTDMLYKMDCIFNEKDSSDVTVEDHWVHTNRSNRWEIRNHNYELIIDKLKECKDCEKYDVPKKYFDCLVAIRQEQINDLQTTLDDIISFLKSIPIDLSEECKQFDNHETN